MSKAGQVARRLAVNAFDDDGDDIDVFKGVLMGYERVKGISSDSILPPDEFTLLGQLRIYNYFTMIKMS